MRGSQTISSPQRSPLAIWSLAFVVAAPCFAFIAPAQAAPYSFQGLGDLPGGLFESSAHGVSADGAVVVGQGYSNSHYEAYRWTRDGGMIGLGVIGSAFFNDSYAYGVSADGSVVVGLSSNHIQHAFRWTSSSGMVSLGTLGNVSLSWRAARSVSADGAVVVGFSNSPRVPSGEAFRWTSDGGMVGLGLIPGGRFFSNASDVSADGSVVVGNGYFPDNHSEAFRWTSTDGMVGLGVLRDDDINSAAWGISADGTVIVGISSFNFGNEAFRWTSESGMVGLGDLPGGSFNSSASDVSANGAVVVGSSSSDDTSSGNAFLWTSATGMLSLSDYLLANGVSNLAGWKLGAATAISADGLTIVGTGVNPSGQAEAWIATIPEPSSLVLAVVGLFALAVIARRRR